MYSLPIASVESLCEDAAAITFHVPEELRERFRFLPGQHVTVAMCSGDREERRSYSICARPGQPLRIGVRVVEGGLVSNWLVGEVAPGDQVQVGPPQGSFTPKSQDPGRRHLFLAAGSGITPVLSIIYYLLELEDTRITLIYANRRTSTVMFAEELADLKDAYMNRFQLIHVLSREPQQVELFSHRLDPDRLRMLLGLLCSPEEVDHFWLCGPYEMTMAASDVLEQLGARSTQVHRELFYVEDAPPPPHHHVEGEPGQTSQVTMILDGKETTLGLAPNEAILDGAQRLRADVPFACRGGVCGTCRAKLLKGEVKMRRNFALEEFETAAGFILTCQSIPISDEVVVDYDS
jgi:ring-1,2-phenylacetyl-CoA epoxidase subunit PaaE